jgi:hypothetical protein
MVFVTGQNPWGCQLVTAFFPMVLGVEIKSNNFRKVKMSVNDLKKNEVGVSSKKKLSYSRQQPAPDIKLPLLSSHQKSQLAIYHSSEHTGTFWF